MRYSPIANPTATKQTEPIDETQVQNNAGGFVYSLDVWGQLERFLILGCDGGTYYVKQDKHAKNNVKCVKECIAKDGLRVVQMVTDISKDGRAMRQDQALFTLAATVAWTKLPEVKQAALGAVNSVCRTATMFFQFLEELKALRTITGRSIRRMIGDWYNSKDADTVAYQVVKYRNRNNWTHADTLRLAHRAPASPVHDAIYKWIVDEEWKAGVAMPRVIEGFMKAKVATTAKEVAELVREYRLPHEALPNNFTGTTEVQMALIETGMPLTATIRNLGNMSKSGTLDGNNDAVKIVTSKIKDGEYVRKSRVHPMSVLYALATYQTGKGQKGSGTWNVVPKVVEALDEAYYKAFSNVEPTGKRFMVALDVSGSMSWESSRLMGTSLYARDGSAALAMQILSVEDDVNVVAFSSGSYNARNASGIAPIPLHRRMSLKEATNVVSNQPAGGTDCALPMLYAMENNIKTDVFIVMTDNETWAGAVHPMEALRQYRKKMGINAKLIVIGMTATAFTIADPTDPGALDIVGFDASIPTLINNFVK
jgi:60 kDa SS-A/Ro ribonucleoprotein